MRYYFDVDTDQFQTRDDEGCELDNEAQMQCEARRVLARIAEDETRFAPRSILSARVRDSFGTPVYRVVLTLEGQSLQ